MRVCASGDDKNRAPGLAEALAAMVASRNRAHRCAEALSPFASTGIYVWGAKRYLWEAGVMQGRRELCKGPRALCKEGRELSKGRRALCKEGRELSKGHRSYVRESGRYVRKHEGKASLRLRVFSLLACVPALLRAFVPLPA